MAAKTPTEISSPSHSANTAAAKAITRSPRGHQRTLAGQLQPVDPGRDKTLALYEAALKLMQAGKYDKAHAAFNEMLASAPSEFAERIRMYIAACVSHIDKGQTEFQSHEERYDYAISLLNQGHYEDARQHFEDILLKKETADYAFYGLAVLASMTGNTGDCIRHLSEAIRLNAQNRFQARLDSDFESVADDPRFTELLYPEA